MQAHPNPNDPDWPKCECGCGGPVPVARDTNRKRGRVKGQPQRFISRHHAYKRFQTHKRCARCGETKPLEVFPNGKSGGYCHPCENDRKREHYQRDPDGKRKKAARRALQSAVLDGRVTKPALCSACDEPTTRLHAHHDDYDCPLDVEWVGPKCHRAVHRRLRAA